MGKPPHAIKPAEDRREQTIHHIMNLAETKGDPVDKFWKRGK